MHCPRASGVLSHCGMPADADDDGERLLVDAALRHNAPEHFASDVFATDVDSLLANDDENAAQPKHDAIRVGDPFDDGDRGEQYSKLLFGRAVPSSHTGDREYALAMLQRGFTLPPGLSALVAAEVDFVALDADHFCFAERVGRLLAALCCDLRVLGNPPRLWHRGVARLAAPLCFLFESDTDAYLVFRELYRRGWGSLHGRAGGTDPARWLRAVGAAVAAGGLGAKELAKLPSASAATVVTSVSLWFQTGFAGFLPSSQTLLVWDRVAADPEHAPEVLGHFAGRIVAARREAILASTDKPNRVAETLQDLSDIDLEHLASPLRRRSRSSSVGA